MLNLIKLFFLKRKKKYYERGRFEESNENGVDFYETS